MLGGGTKGVVLAHQGDATLCDWMPFAQDLAGSGYLVFVFDHRGFGASGSGGTGGYELDALAAGEEIRRQGADSVVLMGASLGALAVMAAAPRLTPQPDGVISLSGPDEALGVDALSAVRDLTAPILLIAATDDTMFRDAARTLFRAAGSKVKTLRILPGADHGTDLLVFDQAATTRSLVFDFLRDHLKG